jgi:hypothetical protein
MGKEEGVERCVSHNVLRPKTIDKNFGGKVVRGIPTLECAKCKAIFFDMKASEYIDEALNENREV